jgi:putative phosphoesterase
VQALIISDLHGNIDALRALERQWDARLRDFDRIICLGDLVDYGADPHEVIEWVRSHATDVVRGNHDHAMATGEPCGSAPAYLEASMITRERLRPTLARGDIEYLHQLPYRATIAAATSTWHLVHATPREPLHDYLNPERDEASWCVALDGVVGQTVLVGHTHVAFVRPVGGGMVINPGSLGMPKDGDSHGSYAVIDQGSVQFRRITYDPEPMIARLGSLNLPERVLTQLARTFRSGT